MKFTIEKNKIINALSKLNGVAKKANSIPILENVAIDANQNKIDFIASDMDIQVNSLVNHDVGVDGKLTVNFEVLLNILKKLNGDNVSFEYDNNSLLISSDYAQFKLGVLDFNEFPLLSGLDEKTEFTLSKSDLNHLIGRVKFAVSNDEMRYYLNGVYWHIEDGVFKSVATDGHRLALSSIESDVMFEGIILPAKTCNHILKIAEECNDDITVYVSNNKIEFDFRDINTKLVSKLIYGTYPDYQRIIPNDNNNELTIDSHLLSNAIGRVTSVTDIKSSCVQFKIQDNKIKIEARNADNSGFDVVDCNADFALNIDFNYKYLLDAVNSAGDMCVIKFKEHGSPIVVNNVKDDNFISIVMPLKGN